MNKYIANLLVILVFISSAFAFAEQNVTPIYDVSDAQGTFIQVPLTHDIYRFTSQVDLQNLVVIDSEKNSLPYRLVSIAPQEKKMEPTFVVDALAFFPVALDATPDTMRKLHTRQITIQNGTTQITTSDSTLNIKTPEFYLIDVSKLDHDITSLVVDWDAQTTNQYIEVELEATRNLQDWFSIGKATLIKINELEQSLKHDHIKAFIAKHDYEFLRLRILRGAENLHINSVAAEQEIGAIETQRRVTEQWRLQGQIAKTQNTVYLPNAHSKAYGVAAWEFVRDEATPIETVAIDFGTASYGDSAKIFSRNSESQSWQLVHQGIWFNIQVGDKWQTSDAVSLYPNSQKYWRLELNESAKNSNAPQLLFSWQPTQLQIIANNKPPFQLAITHEKNNNANRAQVFNQIISSASPNWQNASLKKLDVKPEVVAATAKTINWKQWLFWAALLLAVAVLIAFSLKLFKQLKVADVQ